VKLRLLALAILLIAFVSGCGQSPESGVLSPGEVTPAKVGQVIKVRGKIDTAVENPGGLGGMYLKLGGGQGGVGVRIQDDIWKTFGAEQKAQFQRGKTVMAEGVLFQAGKELVIIYGKTAP